MSQNPIFKQKEIKLNMLKYLTNNHSDLAHLVPPLMHPLCQMCGAQLVKDKILQDHGTTPARFTPAESSSLKGEFPARHFWTESVYLVPSE